MSVRESRAHKAARNSAFLQLSSFKHTACVFKRPLFPAGLTSDSKDAPVAIDLCCSVLCSSRLLIADDQAERNLAPRLEKMFVMVTVVCTLCGPGTVQGSGPSRPLPTTADDTR